MNAGAPTPALFVGHGSPMNALESNRFTEAWRDVGARLPVPRAILAISAHWYIGASAVTAMARPRVIHDFSGFPSELFAFDYPAPGAPDVAAEVAEVAAPVHVALDPESWGIDHGTWSVLAHLFPRADVPVVQLSIDASKELDEHVELGRRLAPLRRAGVLILASGNVVHNLRQIDWTRSDGGFDWARRFDAATSRYMASDPAAVPRLSDHADFAMAAPTPEHFLPLLYLAGLADAAGTLVDPFLEGFAFGSLSMTAYGLDLSPTVAEGRGTNGG